MEMNTSVFHSKSHPLKTAVAKKAANDRLSRRYGKLRLGPIEHA